MFLLLHFFVGLAFFRRLGFYHLVPFCFNWSRFLGRSTSCDKPQLSLCTSTLLRQVISRQPSPRLNHVQREVFARETIPDSRSLSKRLAESKLVHQKLETENFRHAHRSGRAPISLVSNKTRRRRGHPIGSFNPMFPDRHSVRSRSGAQVLSFRVRLNLNTARKLHSIFTVPSCEET